MTADKPIARCAEAAVSGVRDHGPWDAKLLDDLCDFGCPRQWEIPN